MYTPPRFAETDLAELDRLIERDAFVTLVTNDADGLPFASHLPVLYRRDSGQVLLEGHWARPNPQVKHAVQALMIVHGPHAYISPGWYPDKEPAARVPTWNYGVAHLYGELQIFDDTAALSDLIARLSDHFEASVGNDWRFDPERDELLRQLRGIVGFRFVPTRIEMKFKLNQNHPEANVLAAAEGLQALHRPASDEIAAMMLERLAQRNETR